MAEKVPSLFYTSNWSVRIIFKLLGTDRNNILGLSQKNDNFPQVMENDNNMCHHMEVAWQRSEGLANDKMKW